jgi:hypothetical protein
LDIVIGELDTVTDFTAYLTKAEFIRSGRFMSAGGEEDLVAYYLAHMNPQGEHDFTGPEGQPFSPNQVMQIAPGNYERFRNDQKYIAKRYADKQSYVWDTLIKAFTDHMIAGTSISIEGQSFVLSESEQAVRQMALVPRFTRRLLGKSVLEVYEKGRNKPRYTRSFLPDCFSLHSETAFFFMTVAVPDRELPNGYEQYRIVRRRMLETQPCRCLNDIPPWSASSGSRPSPPPVEARPRTLS